MDTIHISDLEVFANHGVASEEQVLGQKFLVDALISLDAEEAGREDDLTLTVNYGQVCRFINEEMKTRKDKLIETVASRLAEAILLEFPLIKDLTLEIRKPWAPVHLPLKYVSATIQRGWHQAYIGVGSNMGDRAAYLTFARERLEELKGIRQLRSADVIETKPVGYINQPDFLNTVFQVETWYSAERLFRYMRDIEDAAGRKREIHWGPRTLDLDMLLYDDLITETPDLIIPHPAMHERNFVLEPLCQLNPWGIHPLYRKRFRDFLQDNQPATGK